VNSIAGSVAASSSAVKSAYDLANNSDSRALRVDATAHANVCKLLMDPSVAGLEYTSRANSDNIWPLRVAAKGRSRRCLQAADESRFVLGVNNVHGILKCFTRTVNLPSIWLSVKKSSSILYDTHHRFPSFLRLGLILSST